MIGIYQIKNKKNEKVYIGQSVYLEERIRDHFASAGKIKNHPLYDAIAEYGEENFDVTYLEILEENLSFIELHTKLNELEHFYVTLLDSRNPERGYNVKGTNPNLGPGLTARAAAIDRLNKNASEIEWTRISKRKK